MKLLNQFVKLLIYVDKIRVYMYMYMYMYLFMCNIV